MPSEPANGQEDTPGASSSSTASTASEFSRQQQRPSRTKHNLRLTGMPPLGINPSVPLVGTPYSVSQPPFEYPFPSTPAASTSLPHAPVYIPSLPSPSPFPYAPALLPRGNVYAFGHVGVESLGLWPPTWRRGASPPHPRFQPSRVEPPMPPGLKERAKEKVQNTSWALAGENGRDEKEGTMVRPNDHTFHWGESDEPGISTDREGATEASRPQSPDVT